MWNMKNSCCLGKPEILFHTPIPRQRNSNSAACPVRAIQANGLFPKLLHRIYAAEQLNLPANIQTEIIPMRLVSIAVLQISPPKS